MFSNQTIVIIDDSEDDQYFAELVLKQGGYGQIIKTFSLNEGIEAVKKHNAQVVMLDLMGLPDIGDVDPTSAHRLLKQECPGVHIIVLSGNRNPEISKEVKADGSSFISKQEALQLSDNSNAGIGSLVKLMSETLPSKMLESRVIYLETHTARLEGYIFNSLTNNSRESADMVRLIAEVAALRQQVKHIEERDQEFNTLREKCNTFESFFMVITGNSSEDRQELTRLRDDLASFNRDMRAIELKLVIATNNAKELDIDVLLEASRRYKWLFIWVFKISTFFSKVRAALLGNVYKELIGLGVIALATATSPKWMPALKLIEKSLFKAIGGD